MRDAGKTNQGLIQEVKALRRRLQKLEEKAARAPLTPKPKARPAPRPAPKSLQTSSEARIRKLGMEAEIIAEIGRIVSSTLKLEETYDRFAAEVKKLIPFDRLAINLVNPDGHTATIAHISGVNVQERPLAGHFPLEHSALKKALSCRSGILIHPTSLSDLQDGFVNLVPNFKEGMRSFMCIPLMCGTQEIGALLFQRKKPRAFVEKDLRLAERIAYQIAGAIANAQLFQERKRFQTQLAQAQKMEALGTLAGGIAHDFNNILTAIIGCAELISLDVPPGSLTERNLQELLKAGHRAKDLVKQILAFSRRSDQERKPLRVDSTLKEALKLLRASLPSTIEIVQDINGEGGFVQADPTQIHQVVMNLCTNSAQAMEEKGGVLTVGWMPVEIDGAMASRHADLRPGPYMRLAVKDTGQGIPPEILERVFDPYFTTKEMGKGTGLGLAVVHGIAKGHGGAVTVSSEIGKGSVFEVYLPRLDGVEAARDSMRPVPLPLGGRERILFIDDEPALVEIGRQILEHLGYEVEGRTSSTEALALFTHEVGHFDLVITDMTMPNMTGDRLAREVLRLRPDIPVILCTGYSEKVSDEQARNMGIRELVMKPLVMRDLAQSVRRALDQKGKRRK